MPRSRGAHDPPTWCHLNCCNKLRGRIFVSFLLLCRNFIGGVAPPASARNPHSPRPAKPSTVHSMMVGQFLLVLTGACQFGHGLGGFTTNFIRSLCRNFMVIGLGLLRTGEQDLQKSRVFLVALARARQGEPCTAKPMGFQITMQH